MREYWDEYVMKYQGKVIGLSLGTILESFWWYCNGNVDRAELVIKQAKEDAK
jgi:hypothetical protein